MTRRKQQDEHCINQLELRVVNKQNELRSMQAKIEEMKDVVSQMGRKIEARKDMHLNYQKEAEQMAGDMETAGAGKKIMTLVDIVWE